MKAGVAAVLITSIAASPVSGMTCTAFRAKLDSAIIAGGRRVAFPRFKVMPGAIVQPDDGGIVGLDTQITCSETDVLQAVDVAAMIDSASDKENLQRHVRFNALVGAALCVLEPRAATACYAEAERTQVAAIKDFFASKARGDQQPSGSDVIILGRLSAVPLVKAAAESITFTVDLTR